MADTDTRITPDDIREQLEALQGDVQGRVDEKKPSIAAIDRSESEPDPTASAVLNLFEHLFRSYHPRDFTVRLWNGAEWPAETTSARRSPASSLANRSNSSWMAGKSINRRWSINNEKKLRTVGLAPIRSVTPSSTARRWATGWSGRKSTPWSSGFPSRRSPMLVSSPATSAACPASFESSKRAFA